jgi:peptidoglycan/LPS O-acetylase OafA/YrhL
VFFGWPNSVIVPLWSVSVEEQFYLLWPPIVARFSRTQIAHAAFWMIVLANIVRFSGTMRHSGAQNLWGNSVAHFDSIAAGILLAVFLKGQAPRISQANRFILVGIAVCCFVLAGRFAAPDSVTPLHWYATLFAYPAIVASCAVVVAAVIGIGFRSTSLSYLGKISYGLYVYHVLCLTLVSKIPFLKHVFLREFVALGLTVVVSSISYAFLERPFLTLKRRFTHIQSRPA